MATIAEVAGAVVVIGGTVLTGGVAWLRFMGKAYRNEKVESSMAGASQSLYDNLTAENTRMSNQMREMSLQLNQMSTELHALSLMNAKLMSEVQKLTALNTTLSEEVKKLRSFEEENIGLREALGSKDGQLNLLKGQIEILMGAAS